jgi:peptidase E
MRAIRQVVAFGGGGFSQESGNPLLDDYVLGLTGTAGPRICFLPTASGDADHYIVRFYNAFRDRARPSHLSLFRRERGVSDARAHLLAQDVIYVGGGSLISLLGVWRAHGIDSMLREAYEAGVILCGLSAGSLCWFAEGLSGYQGEVNRVPALGFLPHSNAVHYRDGDRRGAFHRHLLDGMPPGYAAEDGAALRFVGSELVEVVASRPEARAYKLERRGSDVLETSLDTRYLGAEPPATDLRLARQAAA